MRGAVSRRQSVRWGNPGKEELSFIRIGYWILSNTLLHLLRWLYGFVFLLSLLIR